MKKYSIKTCLRTSVFCLAVLASSFGFSLNASAVEVTFEKDLSLPLVYINFAVKAGSVTDPLGQRGLTNFMGEMLLRGTQSKTKEQIDLALDQMGAKTRGRDTSRSTHHSRRCFIIPAQSIFKIIIRNCHPAELSPE